MVKLKNTTLLFLVKKSSGKITDICLAMKKRGFGAGRWNGVGGKVEIQETIEQATIRETQEEIGVKIKNIIKSAELSFYFPHNTEWDQIVHVYYTENWEGTPTETEEMKPCWFSTDKLPLDKMWPDDEFWLPYFLKEKLIQASFKFGKNDIILEKQINLIKKF